MSSASPYPHPRPTQAGFPNPSSSPQAPEVEFIDDSLIVDESDQSREGEARTRGGALGSILAWSLLGLVACAFGIFLATIYLPERESGEGLRVALKDNSAELATTREELGTNEEELKRVRAENERLSAAMAELEGEHGKLARAVAKKEAQLEAVHKRLRKALGEQIASGSIAVTRRGSELVVDLEHKILFGTGEAELNELGSEVLQELAKTIRANPKAVFQVAGHTDNVKMSKQLQETYATNWELSTARATNVVRFLQEQGKVPGRQLVAAGYSQYRPKATNRSARGKFRNRRIEIIMLAK